MNIHKDTSKESNRLDLYLLNNKLAATRSKAQDLIKSRYVKVNGTVCNKPGFEVSKADKIEVISSIADYVGRAGVKLEHALNHFKINPAGKTCLDIGASTGGFTQCLLNAKAKKVFAVDVGHGQLHPKIAADPRVINKEGTDIRDFHLPARTKINLICADLSFISITLVFPVLKNFCSKDTDIVILIKPQFEVGRGKTKKGIVKASQDLNKAVEKVVDSAYKYGLFLVKIIKSPITGKQGNVEYLAHFKIIG